MPTPTEGGDGGVWEGEEGDVRAERRKVRIRETHTCAKSLTRGMEVCV